MINYYHSINLLYSHFLNIGQLKGLNCKFVFMIDSGIENDAESSRKILLVNMKAACR